MHTIQIPSIARQAPILETGAGEDSGKSIDARK